MGFKVGYGTFPIEGLRQYCNYHLLEHYCTFMFFGISIEQGNCGLNLLISLGAANSPNFTPSATVVTTIHATLWVKVSSAVCKRAHWYHKV